MNLIIRALSILLIFSMLFSLSAFAAPTFTDVNGTEYEHAVSLLRALDILQDSEDGAFHADFEVTRTEVTSVIVRLLGIHNDRNQEDEKSVFSDIDSKDPAYNDILTAIRMGIISGYNNGEFHPEEITTCEQALKMLVCALGYDTYAMNRGGYPLGYIMMGQDMGITKGLNFEGSDYLTRGIMAKLLYNALNIDLIQRIGYGEHATFQILKGKTLLTEKFSTEKKTGRVTAVRNTSLTGDSTLNADEVEIDRLKYKIGSTDVNDFLGYQVEFYYSTTKDSDDKVLIAVWPEKGKNSVLTIKADDVQAADKSKIVYQQDGQTNSDIKEAKIQDTAVVIKNGKYYKMAVACDSSDYMIPSGEIKLLASDGSNTYDAIFITVYDTIAVEKVNVGRYLIQGKYSSRLELDTDSNRDLKYTIYKNGKEVELSTLNEWDILNVAKSDDGNEIKIVVVSDSVRGKVSELAEDDKVVINGQEYQINSSYKRIVEQSNAKKIEIGDQGEFYLDIYGKIAAVDFASSSLVYGYLLATEVQKKGIDSVVGFELINSKGEQKKYKAAKKVYYRDDSNLYRDEKSIDGETVVDAVYATGTVQKVVAYQLNKENELDILHCAVNGYDDNKFSKDAYTTVSDPPNDNTDKWYYDYGRFNFKYFLDDSTVIFTINLHADGKSMTADDVQVIKKSAVADQSKFHMEVYDYKQDMGSVGAVVLKTTLSNVVHNGEDHPIALVDRITSILNDDGETKFKLYVYTGGAYVPLIISDKAKKTGDFEPFYIHYTNADTIDTIYDIKPGDIIQYDKNAKGELELFKPVFIADLNNELGIIEQHNIHPRPCQLDYYAIVTNKSEGRITIQGKMGSAVGERSYNISGSTPIYLYDTKSKKTGIGNLNDIIDTKSTGNPNKVSKLFIRTMWGVIKEIVIYK